MIKCFCNDIYENRLCSTKPNDKKIASTALISHNFNLSNNKEYGLCRTETFCLANSVFRNDTLSIVFTCDYSKRPPLGYHFNECNDTTNVYYRVNMRGEKKQMPMPEYCCQLPDVDFCNLKFTSHIRKMDPMNLFNDIQLPSQLSSNAQSSFITTDQEGVKINIFLMVSTVCVAALLVLALITSLFLIVSKKLHLRTLFSDQTKIEEQNKPSNVSK
jgi:hypothetical protein